MAYASLLSLTQTIEQILQPQFHNEFPLFLDEEKVQLGSLHEKLSNLLLFLENSSPNINSETTSSLEERIRDAAYESQHLVESHMTWKSVKAYEAQHLVPSPTNVTLERLQNVIKKLSLISEAVDKIKMKANNVIGDEDLHPRQTIATIEMEAVEGAVKVEPSLSSGVSSSEPSDKSSMDPLKSNATIEMEGVEEVVKVNSCLSLGVSSSEPTSSDKSSMVGFKSDMLQIKDILTSSSTKLEIISVVGMGGIGKTTLAANIYNDSLVNRHFDIRAWITVSQKYHMTDLLKSLLRSAMEEVTEQINKMDEQELKLKLYQSLKGRRYLIVMDDVWDDVVLEKFGNIFPDDNNGSRIIRTSRSSKVAGSGNSCNHIHHLKFLNSDQSWNLLCQKAFGEERCPPALEDIGKRIAENCNGLPLSLVAIGGVLHKAAKTLAHWEYVEENMKSTKTGNYDRSMEILTWSYNQLPQHLRPCFLYMGVFREDLVIHVYHLIMMWFANGFIKPDSSKTLEAVAMEYLKDLIDRNLIIVRERGYCSGHIKTCVMHDLMRSMCIKKAQEEKFIVVDSLSLTSPLSLKGYRPPSLSDFYSRLSDISTLHSIRCPEDEMQKRIISFQCLKVFDGFAMRFRRFPIELSLLVNLRFIAMRHRWLGEVPVSLSKLRFLQTLLMFTEYAWGRVNIIPLEILKMPQLMHLWVEPSVLPDCSGGRVEKLHTLCGVKEVRFTEETLATFPNLKKLKVEYSSEESVLGSCFEKIVGLCQLEYLKIIYSPTFGPGPDLFQCDLSFPATLRKLFLRGFKLSQRQLSTIGKLPNLEVLKLYRVDFSDSWKIEEEEFGELKFLLMFVSNDEFFWNLEGFHFPSLECLTCICYYTYLPSEIGEIPSLKVINLHECGQFVVDSANKIQEDREAWGYGALQINVYPMYDPKGCGLRRYMLYDLQETWETSDDDD